MGSINTTREQLAVALRSYGEEEAATSALTASDAHMTIIGELAYRKSVGGERLLAKALALAAVEVIEGTARPLRWTRRRIKGVYPGAG